ncbi:MAG: hypothetical protein R6U88_05365 [Candidatus Bipolaricaulota bacterium]
MRLRKWALLVLWLAAVAVSASALNLCEYTMPETNIVEMSSSFSYRYYRDPARPAADINSGRFSIGYSHLYDTSLLGFELVGAGNFVLSELALASMDTQASGRMQRYLGADTPYFAYGGFDGGVTTEFPQPSLGVETGLGYGRFSDVTPLAKALRVERRLLEMGAVAASFPDGAVMDMAKEIGRAEEYETIADLLTAIEELILDATGTRLQARALLALEEIIEETGWERYCGWNVTLGASYDVLDPRGEGRDVMIKLAGDVALAPEPGSQMRLSASYSMPPYPAERKSSVNLTASYDYRLNDITSFHVDYLLRHDSYAERSEGSQSATFQLAFSLGGVDVSVQLAFAKRAEAEEWTQDMVLSAVVRLL